jgi:hypothetical protein
MLFCLVGDREVVLSLVTSVAWVSIKKTKSKRRTRSSGARSFTIAVGAADAIILNGFG